MTVGRNDPTEQQIKANMLQAMVESALQGHELSAWEEGESPDSYFATCATCARSIYVSATSIRSLMAPRCPVQGTVPRIVANLRAAAHLGDRGRFEEAFYTLLAHFSEYTYRDLTDRPDEHVSKAWESLPEEQRRHVSALRRLLDENANS